MVSHYLIAVPAVTVAYANADGRFSVKDDICGFSYGPTDTAGFPPTSAPNLATFNPQVLARIFGTFNGVPPNSGINIINNNDPVNGPILDSISVSPSTRAGDFNVDGAACLRALFTGTDANATRVQAGMNETK